jgi:anaerobic selenocysteine-containing dehydrogenase
MSTREVVSFCRLCVAYCGIVVTVSEDDQVLKVRGDPAHPLSRGYVCSKGRGLPAFHHAPDRLDRPRVRGAECSWEDALEDLAAALRRELDRGDPDAVGMYVATGSAYDTANATMTRQWMQAIGSRTLYTAVTVDNAPALVATELVTGNPGLNPIWGTDRPGLVIIAGSNPVVSHSYCTALPDPITRIRRFRELGGRCWVLDPRRTETAALADEHLAVRPGSDIAVLAALARALLEDGADSVELAHHCEPEHLEALRRVLARFTVPFVAATAGIEPERLEQLIQEVRNHHGQFLVFVGTGLLMSLDGVLAEWLRWVLMILDGSLDTPEGAHFHDGLFGRLVPTNADGSAASGPASRPELPRVVDQLPLVALVDEIEAGNVRALVICGGNPLSAAPEPDRLRRAFRSLETLVVIDVFDRELAQLATHALPATALLERSDLSSYAQFRLEPGVQFTQAVVPPVAEHRPAWWILGSLAHRLGVTVFEGRDPDDVSEEDYLRQLLAPASVPADAVFASGPHGSALPLEIGWVRRDLLPGGRWQIAPPALIDRLERHEPPTPQLVLVPRREMAWMNCVRYGGSGHEPVARVHPDELAAAGVRDGDVVRVESDHGFVQVVVAADDHVRPGVVSMTHGHDGISPGLLVSSSIDIDPLTTMPRTSGLPVRLIPVA